MMRLFIDCEFNDFKGELISIALCPESGTAFYEVVHCDNPSEWVAEHVIPILRKRPISYESMQENLAEYLARFEQIHVVADWPEDIKHFCEALITGPGQRMDTPPLTMEVIRINAGSVLPHNALSDAMGIRAELITQ